MFAKAVASVALMVLSIIIGLGNYWFVFGIWPKNWGLFFLFSFLQVLILILMQKLGKDE